MDEWVRDEGEKEDDGGYTVFIAPHVAATGASVPLEIVDPCQKNPGGVSSMDGVSSLWSTWCGGTNNDPTVNRGETILDVR